MRTLGLEPDARPGNRRCVPPLDRNEPFLGNRNVLESNGRAAYDEPLRFSCRAEGSAKKGLSGKQKIIGKPNVSIEAAWWLTDD